MERDSVRRHVPSTEKRIALVDQYLWEKKDRNLSFKDEHKTPVFDCNGNIHKSLPLHRWGERFSIYEGEN